MKEMNDIENLFGSTFGDEQIVPPTEVKSNIDSALFGTKKYGFLRLLPLILLFAVTSTVVIVWFAGGFDANNAEKSKTLTSDSAVSEANLTENKTQLNQEQRSMINSLAVNNDNSETSNESSDSEANTGMNESSGDFASPDFQQIDSNRSLMTKTSKSEMDSNALINEGKSTNEDVTSDDLSDKSNTIADNGKADTKQSGFDGDETNQIGLYDLPNTGDMGDLNDPNKNVVKSSGTEGMEITSSVTTRPVKTIETSEDELLPLAYLPRTQENDSHVWDVSLYAGLLKGTGTFNAINPTYAAQNSKMSETRGLNFSAEIGYEFNRSLSLVSGLEYHSTNSEVYATLSSDSVLVDSYIQLVYNDPVLMDSVIDTLFIEVYDPVISPNYGVGIKTASFSLPIYMRYTKHFGPKWDLAISAGVRMSYLKQTFNYEDPSSQSPVLKNFNVALALRPELIYKVGRFGFGAYGKFGMDVTKRLQWTDMKRQRYDIGGGIVLRYYF
jgi:hypothetical protein